MKPEILELFGKEPALRVLFALRTHGPSRFGELEKRLEVNPNQLDRALKWLQAHLYTIASTIPNADGPVRVQYDLSKRGRAFLDVFDEFVASADAHRAALGDQPVRELRRLAR